MRAIPGRVINWFKNLPSIPKFVILGIVALILLVALSPVAMVVAGLVLTVSVIVLLYQAVQRKPIQIWGIVAVSSLVLMFVFSGMSGALYGTSLLGLAEGENEVAEDSPLPPATSENPNSDQSFASSGDWESTEAYIDDMVDSEEKVDSITSDAAKTVELAQDGYITDSGTASLLSSARENLDTHRDYFRGTTPPEGFEQYHRITLAGWDLYSEGLSEMEAALYSSDLARLQAGYDTVLEGVDMLDSADQYIPGDTYQEDTL